MKNHLLTLSCCLIFSLTTKAQQDLTMFNFNDIPQSSYANPANQFNGKFFIGLPFLSSTYYSISNSGFAYSDFIKKDGDSLRLDFNSMISELEEKNFLSFNTKIDLLSFGFKIGERTQIMFNATENINFRFRYTKDLITFIHKGNTAFADNTANLEGTGFSANYYREFGLGVSHQFGDKLRVGARFKYLYGIANLDSKKTDVTLVTDPNTYALTANADVLINSSGSLDSTSEQDGFISGNDNGGFGLDLGMNYEVTKRLSINASVIDLGYINWGSNVSNLTIDKGEYTFDGIEIDAFSPQEDSSNTSPFDRITDSLKEAFNVRETNEAYNTPLVGRIYIGANYKLSEKLMVGGVAQSEFYKGSIRPSLTANANYKLTKWIGLGASYSMINRSFNNLGVGINLNPGPVQIYVVSDNILSGFRPQHARHAQVRLGLNLIFGSEKMKEINPSFNGVTDTKRPKKEKKEKKEKKGKEIKEKKNLTPITPVVPETPKSDTIVTPVVPETPEVDSTIAPEKKEIPEQKTDSVIEKKADSVMQNLDVPSQEMGGSKGENPEGIIDKVETPETEIPETEIPKTETPETEIPEIETPIKETNTPEVILTPEKVKSDSTQKTTTSVEVEAPKLLPVTDSVKTNTEDLFEEKVKQMQDSVKKVAAPFPVKVINPSTEITKDSLQQKTDSTKQKAIKAVEKVVEPLKEQIKSDSIPAPVQSAPKKVEPAIEPQ